MNRIYYIYSLINPLTDEPYYVGCTVSLQRRESAHRNFEPSNHCDEKKAIELEIQGAGLIPKFTIIDQIVSDSNRLPLVLEKYWSVKLQQQGFTIVGINPTVRIVRYGILDIERSIKEIKERAQFPNTPVNVGVHLGEDD